VPAGYEFLPVILQAIRETRTISMGYQKFGFEPYVKPVDPYAVKLFHQRWYMLADNRERMSIYALDRMLSASLTEEHFERPADFSTEAYFAEYFGVITDGTPMERVVVRAYGKMASLLRTLPLHATQRELRAGDGYTDFAIDIRPTVDFVSELMSKIDGLDVLEPASLKARVRAILEAAMERNP
jgi:predicted DNA-binding transcriptional regulator YafY